MLTNPILLGRYIRACRERLALTRRHVAEACSVSPNTVRLIEAGLSKRPRRGTLAAILHEIDGRWADIEHLLVEPVAGVTAELIELTVAIPVDRQWIAREMLRVLGQNRPQRGQV